MLYLSDVSFLESYLEMENKGDENVKWHLSSFAPPYVKVSECCSAGFTQISWDFSFSLPAALFLPPSSQDSKYIRAHPQLQRCFLPLSISGKCFTTFLFISNVLPDCESIGALRDNFWFASWLTESVCAHPISSPRLH